MPVLQFVYLLSRAAVERRISYTQYCTSLGSGEFIANIFFDVDNNIDYCCR